MEKDRKCFYCGSIKRGASTKYRNYKIHPKIKERCLCFACETLNEMLLKGYKIKWLKKFRFNKR
jgi:hypothetical protein